MPKYLLLLTDREVDYTQVSEADFDAEMRQHYDFAREVEELGAKILGGEALQPVATATYLRATRTDAVVAVDNPAPDLKEVLGGYYLIEANDDAHARRVAERCPTNSGYVEVRPIWEIPDTNAG
jgi:hypothetical protein